MRQLREQQGLTLKYVAPVVDIEFAHLARFERGEMALNRDQLTALLAVYRAYEPEQREMLLRLAQAVWSPGWEVDFDGAVPDEAFIDMLWLESEASQILCYSPLAVPDLLHPIEHADPSANEQAKARARLQSARQQVLHRQPPIDVTVVLDECALRHPYGDRTQWPKLLQQLIQTAELPGVSLRVLTAGVSRPVSGSVPFTIYCLPEPYPPATAHIEHHGGRLLLADAGPHLAAFETLCRAALDPERSRKSIAACLENPNIHER